MNNLLIFLLIILAAGIISALIILYREKWFKTNKKKLTAIALVGILLGSGIVIVNQLPPAGFPTNFFGSRVAGASILVMENRIVAGRFRMNNSLATPNNITARISVTTADKSISYAIYNDADVLVARTETKLITAAVGGRWVTCSVNWTLNSSVLQPLRWYNITAWSTLGGGFGYLYYDATSGPGINSTSATTQFKYPNPIVLSVNDTSATASIYCNWTLANSAPTQGTPSPTNGSTGITSVRPLCSTNITVTDVDADPMTVCFWENNTAFPAWTKYRQNNSVSSGTVVRSLSTTWTNEYNKKYYWKLTVNDGTTNVSAWYWFKTDDQPNIRINYVGNYSDEGGPHWQPPNELINLETITPTAWRKGYYINDSYQKEPFIYINLSVWDNQSGLPISNAVRLDWHNETAGTWINTTYFTKKKTNYFEYNKTGIPKGKYSFNINVADNNSIVKNIWWNKTGLTGGYVRRYVNLNQTLETVTYRALYLWNATKLGGVDDRYHHDQGGGTINDSNYLLFTTPTNSMQDTKCVNFAGAWFDNGSCVQPFTLTNIYYHFWWSANNTITNGLSWGGWYKNRGTLSQSFTEHFTGINVASRRSSIYWNHPFPKTSYANYSKNFSLETRLLAVTPTAFTDNNIYEMMPLKVNVTGIKVYYPMVISNRSITSFIILNVPSNATLNSSGPGGLRLDSDHDGMYDWDELYRNYTNPFLTDTDNDGTNDTAEKLVSKDPNNWTSHPITYNDVVRNNGVDYFVWLGSNTTAYWVNKTIVGMNSATESISIWNRTSWSTTTGLWQTYNGTKTGINWTVHTFQIIRTILADAAGNQTITMTANPSMDYEGSHSIKLVNTTTNKGYNQSAYNRVAATTLQTINTTGIGLASGDMVSRWNRTTFTWDNWISYFGPHDHAVSQWDVIQTKVSGTKTWTT